MSELPFEIPADRDSLLRLLRETREKLAALWNDLSEEAITRRPGPHPEWSVKNIISHICWWEAFAIARIPVLAAGLEITPVEDYDKLNAEVDRQIQEMPLETALAQFEANGKVLAHLIGQFSFEEWADEARPNFKGRSLMYLLGANTFGHYYDHFPDLEAYREKVLT